MTRPVPPSIVITSPSRELVRRRVARSAPSTSIVSASQPATHGLPIPRATTAACEVMPAVRGQDPLRLDHPVDVVRRRLPADEDHALARLARARRRCRRRRRSAPTAAPGEAFRPLRRDLDAAPSGRSSGAGAGRAAPGRCARPPPRARSAPRRPCRPRPAAPPRPCASPCASAAGRACPSSTVNSMSCMSR